MGLFSALSGKIYRFNSINIPIDNGMAERIKKLDESYERLVIIMAFGIAQQIIQEIFHPDHGVFKKSLDSLTKDSLEKIYYIILDSSLNQIIAVPVLNIDQEKLINEYAKVAQSTQDVKTADINIYKQAESGVMKAYENVCLLLNRKGEAQSAISFGTTYLNLYNSVVDKLGEMLYK